jgi:hypothetical protein
LEFRTEPRGAALLAHGSPTPVPTTAALARLETKHEEQNRRTEGLARTERALPKIDRTQSKQKDSLPNLAQMQFNLARSHTQEIIA